MITLSLGLLLVIEFNISFSKNHIHFKISYSKEEGKTWRETFPVTYDDTDGRFLYSEDDGCGKSLDEGQIVGGKEAKIGELPFMALLGYRKPGLGIAYQCGGTLINRFAKTKLYTIVLV